jgi:hypothetical protein
VYIQPGKFQEGLSRQSAELNALEAEISTASPGQKYLLQRKLEGLRKDSGKEVAARTANDIHDALKVESMESVREQPVNSGAPREQGRAILNASFLVKPARVVDFQRALTAMVNRFEPAGCKFDFTGPWPPYHFVGERAE